MVQPSLEQMTLGLTTGVQLPILQDMDLEMVQTFLLKQALTLSGSMMQLASMLLCRPIRSTPYPKLGILGTSTPGGWDSDTDLTSNASNPFLWSKIVTLTDGVSKFRANDAWDVNWGASDFPGGISAVRGTRHSDKRRYLFRHL